MAKKFLQNLLRIALHVQCRHRQQMLVTFLGKRNRLLLLAGRRFGQASKYDLRQFIEQGELGLLDGDDSSQCLLSARGFAPLVPVIGEYVVAIEFSLDCIADESRRGGIASPPGFPLDLFRKRFGQSDGSLGHGNFFFDKMSLEKVGLE